MVMIHDDDAVVTAQMRTKAAEAAQQQRRKGMKGMKGSVSGAHLLDGPGVVRADRGGHPPGLNPPAFATPADICHPIASLPNEFSPHPAFCSVLLMSLRILDPLWLTPATVFTPPC